MHKKINIAGLIDHTLLKPDATETEKKSCVMKQYSMVFTLSAYIPNRDKFRCKYYGGGRDLTTQTLKLYK